MRLLTLLLTASLFAMPASADGVPDRIPLLPCTEEYLYVPVGPVTVTRDSGCSVPEVHIHGRTVDPQLNCPKFLVAIPLGPVTVYYAPCSEAWVEDADGDRVLP